MRIGYARVSTDQQFTDGQRAALEADGCEKVYVDNGVSGAKASRPEWDKCLSQLREGDVLVTVRLDRIGRSVRNLIDVVNLLGERGVDLVVIEQKIDTTTSEGKFLFHILAAVAEFERDLIRARTNEGLAAAKRRKGVDKLSRPGRKPKITPAAIATARDMHASGKWSMRQIAEVVGCSPATVYRHLDLGGAHDREEGRASG